MTFSQNDIVHIFADGVLESWVGRTRNNSTELRFKSPTSHVARMTSGLEISVIPPQLPGLMRYPVIQRSRIFVVGPQT